MLLPKTFNSKLVKQLFFSLAKYDLIVTTYGTVMSEMKSVLSKTKDVKLDDMGTVEDEGLETK